MTSQNDRIEHIILFMEYDNLSDAQGNLIISFEDQWRKKGYLSQSQFEILESIFKQAAEK